MLDLEFAEISDTGRVREHNEDYMGHAAPQTPEQARSHGWMFVLADGVGGLERGEVASKTAVESMLEGFRKASAGEAHSSLLPRLVQCANERLFEIGSGGQRGSAGMATTIVACALCFDRAVIAHVGDSRCYLIRRGEANQLTRDHTIANEQVRLGIVSAQEASEGGVSHVLSRSLGTKTPVAVEVNDQQVQTGDALVLCSDGLYGSVTGAEMAAAAGPRANLEAAAKNLVALANERDGSDNVSICLIRIRGVERMGMYRGRPYKLA